MTKPIPTKPTDLSATGWILWANEHFPFAADWQKWLITRAPSERPQFGTYESLEDLRGIEDRRQAGMCAWHWWHTFENQKRILESHQAERQTRQADERRRLLKLAQEALDGHLGQDNESRNNARATAQSVLGYDLSRCSDDDLSDWMKMHEFAKVLARNPNAKRPRLAADARRQADQRRQIADLDKAIAAAPAGKPRAVPQREMFG